MTQSGATDNGANGIDSSQTNGKRLETGKSSWLIFLLAVYFILLPIAMFTVCFYYFPSPNAKISERQLFFFVIFSGAMGSYVHAATSFASFVGNRKLVNSWGYWYILRLFIGMALAAVFYLVLRAGFFSANTAAEQVNLYGFAAVGALAGMFSKQATEKLREVFDNLFKTEKGTGDDARMDKMNNEVNVEKLMIPAAKITALRLEAGQTEKDVTTESLYLLLQKGITRIPVFQLQGQVFCVVHGSLLYKYIAQRSLDGSNFDIKTATLAEFLDFEDMTAMVKDSLAFVAASATIAEAKQKMKSTNNSQDVFVTETGRSSEPVKGWLTNVELMIQSG